MGIKTNTMQRRVIFCKRKNLFYAYKKSAMPFAGFMGVSVNIQVVQISA
jgi:hypothetical protein